MQKKWMVIAVITLASSLLSCEIINPSEVIPSYIKIDTVKVKVTNFDQGSASHKMTCVKVNVAGTTIGFFEMPALVPSLSTGPQSLFIEPVFELNGIDGSREVYPFFKPYIGTGKFDLVPGEVITVEPVTTYKAECKFPWIEDFEDAGVSFLYPAYSDTSFRTRTDSVKEGRQSGVVYLDKTNRFFEAYSNTDFVIPITNSQALVEFDYKSNALLEFGAYVLEDGYGPWNTLVYIRPSATWNRIYLDLHTLVEDNQTAEGFRIGFRAAWDSTKTFKQSVSMDNLKLIHF